MWTAAPGCPPRGVRLLSRDSSLRQSIRDEFGNTTGGGRVHVGEDGNHIAGSGTDLQISIHSRRTAAMTEATCPVHLAISKSIGVAAIGRFRLACSEQFRVMRVQQLVFLDCVGKS